VKTRSDGALAESLEDRTAHANVDDLLKHVKKRYPLEVDVAAIATPSEAPRADAAAERPRDFAPYAFRMDLWRL